MKCLALVAIPPAIAAAVLTGGSSRALALCGQSDPATPGVVFDGTIVARTDSAVTFDVDTVYRGSAFETETIRVTQFSDDVLGNMAVGTRTVVEAHAEPLTGRISVPMCTSWDSSSWSRSDGHPPASGILGRLRTHPLSMFTALWLAPIVVLFVLGWRLRARGRARRELSPAASEA